MSHSSRTARSPRRGPFLRLLSLPTVLTLVLAAVPAHAQGRAAPRPRPTAPRPPAPPPPPAPAPDDEEVVAEPQAETMVAVPGGITAERAALRASATSWGGKAAEETAQAASERIDAATLGYAPRLALSAGYTRFSPLTSASTFGSASLVVTQAPAGTVNPQTVAAGAPNLNTVIVDNYIVEGTLTVPVTDYVVKTKHDVAAASLFEQSTRYDILVARAASYENGKEAYYNWLRTRGAQLVAAQAVAVAVIHLRDSKTLFEGGNVSSADVLRAETNVAEAELTLERAKMDATNLDWHIRTVIHAADSEKLEPGESLEGALAPVNESLPALIAEGYNLRPEIKSFALRADSLRRTADSASSKRYPALNGVGDVTYANPNARQSPAQAIFFPTWTLGATVTWAPNDFLAAGPAAADARARAASLDAQAAGERDTVLKEVVEAYTSLRAADAAVGSTSRQLESAIGGYRVARQLYQGGRTNGTAVLDAETALSQARFAHLNARADARIARAQLDHAIGRDTRIAVATMNVPQAR